MIATTTVPARCRSRRPNSHMALPGDELLVKELILSIPEAYRDVFVLSRFQGLTYEEIATRCGLSVKSVEWRLGKAIAHCMTARSELGGRSDR